MFDEPDTMSSGMFEMAAVVHAGVLPVICAAAEKFEQDLPGFDEEPAEAVGSLPRREIAWLRRYKDRLAPGVLCREAIRMRNCTWRRLKKSPTSLLSGSHLHGESPRSQ